MILYYGRGKGTLSANQEIKSLIIRFRGNPFIMHYYNTVKKTHNPNMGHIFIKRGIVALTGSIEGEIFKYRGYMKVFTCQAGLSNGETVNIQVKPSGINYPELMDEKPEDISTKPEKLKHTYTYFGKFKGRQYDRTRRTGIRSGISQNRGRY